MLSQNQLKSLALLYTWLDDIFGTHENELDEVAEFVGVPSSGGIILMTVTKTG